MGNLVVLKEQSTKDHAVDLVNATINKYKDILEIPGMQIAVSIEYKHTSRKIPTVMYRKLLRKLLRLNVSFSTVGKKNKHSYYFDFINHLYTFNGDKIILKSKEEFALYCYFTFGQYDERLQRSIADIRKRYSKAFFADIKD